MIRNLTPKGMNGISGAGLAALRFRAVVGGWMTTEELTERGTGPGRLSCSAGHPRRWRA